MASSCLKEKTMQITGFYKRTIWPTHPESATLKFSICQYESYDAITLPNGTTIRDFKAKGLSLPTCHKTLVILNGHWELDQDDNQYVFVVSNKELEKEDLRILEICSTLDSSVLEQIEKDPYLLVLQYEISFYVIDKLVHDKSPIIKGHNRIKAAMLQVLIENEMGGPLFSKTKQSSPFFLQDTPKKDLSKRINSKAPYNTPPGSTFLLKDLLLFYLPKLLDVPISEELFNQLCVQMHQDKQIFITSMLTQENEATPVLIVYRYQTAIDEYVIAKKLTTLNREKIATIKNIGQKIKQIETLNNVLLTDEQRQAVYNSMTNMINIITGGPGTGKTAVQKILLETYRKIYPSGKTILLTAPTGMASKRMSEATGFPASTLHSALGLSPQPIHIAQSKQAYLNADFIIVDETSMIDTHLMRCLLDRIKPGAQLTMIGDVDQLPSVGAGCILQELIASKAFPITNLSHVFRQKNGSTIAINTARIRAGKNTLLSENDFEFKECHSSAATLEELCNLYPNLVDLYGIDNVAVLAPYRQGTCLSVNCLNPLLQSLYHQKNVNQTNHSMCSNGQNYYIGDKVIMTKNYKGLVNGDTGYITTIEDSDTQQCTVKLSDSGELRSFKNTELSLLTLAYATTIHKSQGNEYAAVILIVDDTYSAFLNKNLFYTGITRAKSRLYILGNIKSFVSAISNQSVPRNSQLAYLLRRALL